MKSKASVALVVLALAASAGADEIQIEVDPDLTSISFRLQATLHSVDGTSSLKGGSFRLDSESGIMTGSVAIDATSADTGNKKRDKKMHQKVLLSARHPEIILQARRLEGEVARHGTSDVILHGAIQILGRPHDVRIPLHIEVDGDRFAASIEFDLPYVEWGLEDPSTFVLRVAKTVRVKVAAGGSLEAAGISQ
jgi:polyisoprenoid-binding protein YceI